jgi:DNA repair protein RecN (Recombination protein N)
MLTELVIRDLALIEAAEVELSAGLNALTGETGAGKSLLVGSLELLAGETPRGGASSWVRRDAAQARVEGRFQLTDARVIARLEACLRVELPELAEELHLASASSTGSADAPRELELILGRTLGRDGRTRAHVNQRPVPLRALAKLAGLVLEIHGQNDHQRLLQADEQLRLFDAYAGLEDQREAYAHLRAEWLTRRAAHARASEHGAERRERLELLRFQREELTAAKLAPGELATLLEERELLRGAGELRTQLGGVLGELTESDAAVLDRVKAGVRALERWGERLPRLAPALAGLREAEVHLADAGATLASLLAGVADDPARLEALEARLAELEELARKHRTDEEGLLEVLARVERELAELEGPGTSLDELAAEAERARLALERAGAELATRRRAAAPRLNRAVQAALAALGLANARFQVSLVERAGGDERYGPHGLETLEFRLAANPGEPWGALARVASYGEAARIMLALRTVLSAGDRGRTLVFDEIDSGVGGRLGPEVGAALRALGSHHQVLCVTHLPAIAAAAAQHLSIAKDVRAGRTHTAITRLDGDARVAEVADMIAGGADQATARAEARRLLEDGHKPSSASAKPARPPSRAGAERR